MGKLLNGEIDEIRVSNSLRYPTAYVNNSFYTIPQAPFSADGNTLVLFHLDNNLNDVSGNSNYAQLLDQSNFPQVVNYTNSTITTTTNTVVNNSQTPSVSTNSTIINTQAASPTPKPVATATPRPAQKIVKQVIPAYKVLTWKGFMSALKDLYLHRYKLSY